MGTYDTRGGAPLSPNAEDPPCDTCGGDPCCCDCKECPSCGATGDPRCPISETRALDHARQLIDAHRINDYRSEAGSDDWMIRKAAALRRVAGAGCVAPVLAALPSHQGVE